MRAELRPALVLLLLFTLLTGAVYPLAVTLVAQLAFPRQARGSLIVRQGRPVGSRLVGQPFDDPKYFWGRLSAAGAMGYDGAASGGSNLGPLHPALLARARARIAELRAADPDAPAAVPVDLVTASGSGLDPDITPAAASFQAGRVARARGLGLDLVGRLIREHTEGRVLGLLGEPRVHVLELNLALDEGRGGVAEPHERKALGRPTRAPRGPRQAEAR